MVRRLKLILMFARVSVQNDAAYRFDFLMRIGVAVLHLAAELMGVWVIYSNTKSLNGWGVWESLTLLGVYRAIIGSIRDFHRAEHAADDGGHPNGDIRLRADAAGGEPVFGERAADGAV